jgi:hypothetical protein
VRGNFAILDARSQRIIRVCRSTFAAELYSTEEALDVGTFCRGALCELRGKDIKGRKIDAVLETVPLEVVKVPITRAPQIHLLLEAKRACVLE